MKPVLTIVVCTYNGGNLLRKCFDSIFSQTYKNFEVLCVEAGSTDGTKETIKEYKKKYGKIRVIFNKNKLPEGKGYGKWLGFKKSRGKIVGIVDQDNILQRNDFFSKIVSLFSKDKKIMTISAGLKNDRKDPPVVRYISLFGTDSFFAYRSVDFIRTINRKKADIERYEVDLDNMILAGSNCLFYSKENANPVGGYDQDMLLNQRLAMNGKNILYVIKNATKHYSDKNLRRLATKKFMWGSKYFAKGKTERFNYLPSTKKELFAFSKNLLFNLLILPNFFYAFKAYENSGDCIAFLFPLMAFLNTLAYGLNFLKEKLAVF